MNFAIKVILFLVVTACIVLLLARNASRKLMKNTENMLKSFILEEGSDREYFEEKGVKYDKEKYEEYLANYCKSLTDQQLTVNIKQRSARSDVWSGMFCAALTAEQSRRDEAALALEDEEYYEDDGEYEEEYYEDEVSEEDGEDAEDAEETENAESVENDK